MRASVVGDGRRHDRLRAQGRVVHHVYRNAQQGELLIHESFSSSSSADAGAADSEFLRSEG